MRTIGFMVAVVVCFSSVHAQEVTEYESMPGVRSLAQVVEVDDGSQLQVVITQPEGTNQPLNPLLFVQWVSCGSLAYREGGNSSEVHAALARDSGLSLVRVERSALGHSGPSCAELDYDTEIDHYVQAFRQVLGHELIDSSRVYLYGSSLGATIAPLVAHRLQDSGNDIAGIMVQGGGGVTHLERMIAFDRFYLERRPEEISLQAIHSAMVQQTAFQVEYLVKGRHPDEIAQDSESMAQARNNIRGLNEADHYGRPFAWHQQAAQHDFLSAWAAVDAPVLVIFNEFDQFETRHGHAMIADMVNRVRPGTATLIERPNVGHSNNRYATIEDAYVWRDGSPAWQESAELMVDWLRGLRTQ